MIIGINHHSSVRYRELFGTEVVDIDEVNPLLAELCDHREIDLTAVRFEPLNIRTRENAYGIRYAGLPLDSFVWRELYQKQDQLQGFFKEHWGPKIAKMPDYVDGNSFAAFEGVTFKSGESKFMFAFAVTAHRWAISPRTRVHIIEPQPGTEILKDLGSFLIVARRST